MLRAAAELAPPNQTPTHHERHLHHGFPIFTLIAADDWGGAGCVRGTVSGSFVHLVDRAG
ncbi:MAG: hypothetical protein OXU22_01900 [Gammaproteobacteria bacterium]|nr:hypothetical protein [Gammaproteobacteria bacterium]